MTPVISRRVVVAAAIGATQTIAWASSYYLPAILAGPIAKGLGLSQSVFFAAFSAALLLSAALGPAVGRVIDRHGGRVVLTLAHLVIAAGLLLLAAAHGFALLAGAWTALGVGIAMGLYDPAFAALTRLYGREARRSISGVTLIAGFASTIGWPLTALFLHLFGWRAACLAWAALDIVIAAPLNWLLIPPVEPEAVPPPHTEPAAAPPPPPRGAMPVLAFYFSVTWFVTAAMAAHLPRLLELAGASESAAIAAAALVGPAQVAARLAELGILKSLHPLVSGRLAALLHPLGAIVLSVFGAPAVALFALLHGAGNGIITIAKGTLPLALFGPSGFGRRSGVLSAPARALQAVAPFLFGLLLDRFGVGALALSAGLNIAAFLSLFLLRARASPSRADAPI
ncbi:MAG TPA: MFS transporter [Stellaceae bacterium]|nr:MFS transporter [Stellaceae bacterium]